MPVFAHLILVTAMASTAPVLKGDARTLADGCIADGQKAALCECYAGFVADNTSTRELEALTVLTDPRYRSSMAAALKALTAKGLKPNEIFSMAQRAEALTNKARAQCEPTQKTPG